MIEFKPIGPFKLPVSHMPRGGKRLSESVQATNGLLKTEFWKDASNSAAKFGISNLAKAKGIYVFGLKVGRGFTPYYVGKTGKQTLATEPFTAGKLVQYNECLGKWKGTPVMFFLPLPVKKGPDNQNVIANAERFLIELAFAKNPTALLNKKHAKTPTWSIRGVLRTKGKGAPTTDARTFKAMMGLC
ncbi:MAG: hypothetical protein IID51_02635 [Proteobacteria bacterium]|nr:hypothetical protein [Pseudomonadota bacterium]